MFKDGRRTELKKKKKEKDPKKKFKRGGKQISKNRQRKVEPMSNRPLIGFFDVSHL